MFFLSKVVEILHKELGSWRHLNSFDQIAIYWFGSGTSYAFHFVNSAKSSSHIVKKQFLGVWDCNNWVLKKEVSATMREVLTCYFCMVNTSIRVARKQKCGSYILQTMRKEDAYVPWERKEGRNWSFVASNEPVRNDWMNEWMMKWYIKYIIYYTANVKSNELWSSQLRTQ